MGMGKERKPGNPAEGERPDVAFTGGTRHDLLGRIERSMNVSPSYYSWSCHHRRWRCWRLGRSEPPSPWSSRPGSGRPANHRHLVFGSIDIMRARLTARHRLSAAVPDLVFGSIAHTGLLVIPTLLGGLTFGVAGAIAGTVIGDALTDAIAGFFEGNIAEWLRSAGFSEAREPVPTSLGKMAGALLGAGLVLSIAWLVGVDLLAA